jgi:hypothetical protein
MKLTVLEQGLLLGLFVALAIGVEGCTGSTTGESQTPSEPIGLQLPGASFLSQGKITSIAEILNNSSPSSSNQNTSIQPVQIKGKVQQQAPLLNGQVYQLQDATGTIWVLSPQTNLHQGDIVVVKGLPRYQSISIARQEWGEVYLEEQEVLDRQTNASITDTKS